MSTYNGLEVAVIGIAGKFPKADNVEQYWQNLINAKDCIQELTEEEILAEGESEASLKSPNYVKVKAYMDNKEYFDAAFFGYRADEALLMDPQLRIFHECCWTALEDSGYNLEGHKDKIGVFASGAPNLNWEVFAVLKNREGLVDEFTASQLRDISFLSTRVSYLLNLKGPSLFMQTACSSSLVAVNEAVKSLLLGECNIALAGGVRIMNHSKKGYFYEPGMVYSKDGRSRPFDADSNGTVAGEGVGVVVLKRLKDAIKDNDHIYAVIKGTNINNDGNRKVGFTAPSVKGQVEVIKKAHMMGNVDPKTITYIEAHGTGTQLGDPIEIEALNEAFGPVNGHRCAVGSVKSNIGHLDCAAGIAGFIKVVLSLKNKMIPPSLHFDNPNPKINFENGPFYIINKLQDWKSGSSPLRAAVSSFGIGGTNAHVVLEEAPVRKHSETGRDHQLILLSAKSEKALKRNTDQLIEYLKNNTNANLPDVAGTLQMGRTRMEYRKAVVGCNVNEVIGALQEKSAPQKIASTQEGMQNIVFMFSGQGAQYKGMCQDLYLKEPVFKGHMDDCFRIAKQYSTEDFYSILFKPSDAQEDTINQTNFAQPLLFFIEYSMAKLLMAWGINPNYMIGHSIGEYVAACLSDVFRLQDAIRLVIRRGEWMVRAATGSMLSLSMTPEQLRPLLSKNDSIDLAVANGPASIVVSGPSVEIEKFEKKIVEHGYQAKKLHTSHAFHSRMMDEILVGFENEFRDIEIREPRIPYISNISGNFVSHAEISDKQYWSGHLREAVQFSKGIDTLLAQGAAVLIEVGPGQSLCNYARESKFWHEGYQTVNMIRHPKQLVSDDKYLTEKLGQLWLNGLNISWTQYYNGEVRNRIPLPTYSFEKSKFPVHVNAEKMLAETISHKVAKQKDISTWFYVPSWTLASSSDLEIADDTKMSLIFGDSSGISESIATTIEEKAGVILVTPSDHFECQSSTSYLIDPSNKEDYDQLFLELSKNNSLPDRIIHSWGMSDNSSEKTIELTYRSLLHIISAFKRHGHPDCKLVLLTQGLHPVLDKSGIDASKSLAAGLLKVIAQENADIITSHIDLDGSEAASEEMTTALYREICNCESGKTISLRHGQRWELIYNRVSTKKSNGKRFRQDGVYLITGGLGSFGYHIASYLQKQFGAKLILLGRRSFEHVNGDIDLQDRFTKLQTLQANGSVLYFNCDLKDLSEFSRIVIDAEKKLGKINGVFHAAGDISRNSMKPVHELTQDDLDRQFNPKVAGLQVLQQVFDKRQLDFCLITSSLSSVLGGIGYGAYAPANTFMDYLAKQVCTQSNQNWISVNFDAFDLKQDHADLINDKEMIEVVDRALSLKRPQVVVSIFPLQEKLEKWIYKINVHQEQVPALDDTGTKTTEDVASSFDEDLNKTQKHLLALWRNFFSRANVQLDDNFFEIGGDSLKALTIIGRIHKTLKVEIPIAEFFNRPSIRQISEYADLQLNNTKQKDGVVIPKAKEQSRYRLSSVQRRLYFLYEFDRQSLAYILTKFIKLKGKLDRERLNHVFQQLVNRHGSLRTSFEIIGGEPFQIVHDHVDFDIDYYQSGQDGLDAVILDFLKPFDLAKGNLMKVGLVETASDEYTLMFSMHHIITDGVSRSVLINDLMALYNGGQLPELRLQYKDFSEWQQGDFYKKLVEKQRAFWLQEFSEIPESLELPADFKRPRVRSFEGESIPFEISSEATQKLNEIAKEQGASLYMVTLALFKILLHKLSNQNDILVGTVTSGRQHADLEEIVGMFVNTLVVRNQLKEGETFIELLQKVKAKVLTVLDNQDYQYEDLLNDLKLEKDTSRNPLFDVMFSFENEVSSNLQIKGLELEAYDIPLKLAQFDFKIRLMQTDGKLNCAFEYVTALFQMETIRKFIAYFQNVITTVIANMTVRISDIEIITSEEKNQILHEFNDTDRPFETQKTVIDLFEESVKKYPSNTAIVADGIVFTYDWVNATVNRLAHLLRTKGVSRESSVVVIMERRVELLIALLAILKAGGKYVPVEPAIPDNRIEDIAESVQAKIIISNQAFNERVALLKNRSKTVDTAFLLDSDAQGNLEMTELTGDILSPVLFDDCACTNPEKLNDPEDLAYVIFTSGSTGNPKGVAVQHRPVINLIEWLNRMHHINCTDKVLMVSSISFDLSVYDIFGFFAAGATVRIASRAELAEPDALASIIIDEGITLWDSAPAMLQQVIPSLENRRAQALSSGKLRLCFLSGDWIPLAMPKQMKSVFNNLRFVAMGGATEATVWSNYHIVEDVDPDWNSIPYGKPMQNARYLVLDKGRNLCPVGIPGDLYIGGVCLATGYFNDPELTNKKFIKSPFYKREMLYDTGDMARWFPDGNIEFLGRKDSQVKIRGYRIELGEIESQLLKFKGIDSVLAQVITRSKYDKSICVYYISSNEVAEEELRVFLSETLPNYMIPQFFVHLDHMPMTKNGKIDRKSLPVPQVSSTAGSIKAPVNEMQKYILKLWSQLLQLPEDKISITHDFFEYGGHSIMAVHLINLIQEKYQVRLKLREIFTNATIEKLAALTEKEKSTEQEFIPIVGLLEYYPVSSAQERLYYEQLLNPANLTYNITGAYRIEGAVDLNKLTSAFKSLINRHEALRTSFSLKDDKVVQKIQDNVQFNIELFDGTRYNSLESVVKDFKRPFELSNESLFRCGFVSLDKENILLVDVHHIACDGLSMNILLKDFKDIYLNRQLKPLILRYVDYASWQRTNPHVLEKQKQYWIGQLSGELPQLNLPVIQDRAFVASQEASISKLPIEGVLCEGVRNYIKTSEVTPFVFFLSVYYILLAKISGDDDVIVATDVIGRSNTALSNIVGTFINLLPLRMNVSNEMQYDAFLKKVKDVVLNGFENQDFQFDQIVSLLKAAEKPSNPITQVHFAFANYLDQEADVSGLNFTPLEITSHLSSNFEFKIEVWEQKESYQVLFVYNHALYDQETIEFFKQYYLSILYSITSQKEITLEKMDIQDKVDLFID